MDNNNWVAHFAKKPAMTKSDILEWKHEERVFFSHVEQQLTERRRILEAGCGPACRMIAFCIEYDVTALMIDRSHDIIRMTMQNRDSVGAHGILCEILDFFALQDHFQAGEFDVVTHHGVLEHYEPDEIVQILNVQLSIASSVVFAVPIKSSFNDHYFQSSAHISRNFWTQDEWLGDILAGFDVTASETVRTNKDELIVSIKGDKTPRRQSSRRNSL